MRILLCSIIGALLLLGSVGCMRNDKPQATPPTQMMDLPDPPVAAGAGGPKKPKADKERSKKPDQPKNDKEPSDR